MVVSHDQVKANIRTALILRLIDFPYYHIFNLSPTQLRIKNNIAYIK